MFCARVLRTPKRFDNSTGSNISTSTPVNALKSCKPDELNHSPIEKSNDNSKEFYAVSRGSINLKDGMTDGAPFSPLAGGVNHLAASTSMNKRVMVKNAISTRELRCIASDKMVASIRKDLDEHPIHGLRTSPRDIMKNGMKERSATSLSIKSDRENEKENKKIISGQKNLLVNGTRRRTKSNIPMRRKSVSLQDFALIQSKNDAVKPGEIKSHIAVKTISSDASKITTTNSNVVSKKPLSGQNQEEKGKSLVTLDSTKPVAIVSKSKSDQETNKSTKPSEKVIKENVSRKTKGNSVEVKSKKSEPPRLVENKKTESAAAKDLKKSDENVSAKSEIRESSHLSKINEVIVPSKSKSATAPFKTKTSDETNCLPQSNGNDVIPFSSESKNVVTEAKPKSNGSTAQIKSKTDIITLAKSEKNKSAFSTKPKEGVQCKSVVDKKTADRTSKSTNLAPKSQLKETGETDKGAAKKDLKTNEVSEQQSKPTNKAKTSEQNNIETVATPESSENVPRENGQSKSPTKKSKSPVKVMTKKPDDNKTSPSKTKTVVKTIKSKDRAEDKVKSKTSTSEVKCVIGAKIFAQENTLKSLSDAAPLANSTCRDSCGSQRNSDTFQVNASSKTLFVKRKLYSNCGDFNNDSDGNQDSSFLVQKNITNIYCIKKNATNTAESKAANSGSDTSKNNNERAYSLRNNKNAEEEYNVKNTCDFVTKILEDINSKNKPTDSNETSEPARDAETKKSYKEKREVSKDSKKKTKADTSSNDIFDQCDKPKTKTKKESKKDKDKKISKVSTTPVNKDKGNKKSQKKRLPSSAKKVAKATVNKDVENEKPKKKRTSVPSVSKPSENASNKEVEIVKPKKKQSSRKSLRLSKLNKDHSSDLIIVKGNRNAKNNALDKIHDWSLSLINSSINKSQNNSQTMPLSIKKGEKKRIVVNKECSYLLRSSGVNDSNVSLSPHLRKAISKLKEQHHAQLSSTSKKPVRRSLDININRKKVIASTERRHVEKKQLKDYKQDLSVAPRSDRKEKGGQVMAFRNGQLITIDKGSSINYLDNSKDDSFYNTRTHIKQKKMTCNFDVKKSTLPRLDYDNMSYSIHHVKHGISQHNEPKYMEPMPILRDPFEYAQLKKYAMGPSRDTSALTQQCEINKTLICPPSGMNDRASQHHLMPYNTSMYAMVPARPVGMMNHYSEFKMPMGNYMPGVSHKRTTYNTYSRNTSRLMNTRHNDEKANFNFRIGMGNPVIPDFIKHHNTMAMSFQGDNPVNTTYSFCSKELELLKNKYSDRTVREQNMNRHHYVGQVNVPRLQAEDNRKRKYAEDFNDVTVYSKKSRYDDEMSLCSTAGGRPMSSTKIYGNNTQHLRIPDTSDQSVCKFIVRAPLITDPNKIRRQVSNISTHRIKKPDIQLITTTNHTIIEQNQDECNFSDDMNETVVSAQPYMSNRTVVSSVQNMTQNNTQQMRRKDEQVHRTTTQTYGHHKQPRPMVDEYSNYRQVLDHRESEQNRTKQDGPTRFNNGHTTHKHQLISDQQSDKVSSSNIVKKYKFSSEDVYNFGKKPQVNEAPKRDDTFYFKGAYNKYSDVSSVVNQNATSVASSDTFRKPSISILGSKKSSGSHNSSIVEKYNKFHAANKTPKRKHIPPSTKESNNVNSNPATGTPVNSTSDKNSLQNRNLVSPWRLW